MIIAALVQWPTLATAVMAPVLAITYIRLAAREESALRQEFGAAYGEYAHRTPAFLPDVPGRRQPAGAPR